MNIKKQTKKPHISNQFIYYFQAMLLNGKMRKGIKVVEKSKFIGKELVLFMSIIHFFKLGMALIFEYNSKFIHFTQPSSVIIHKVCFFLFFTHNTLIAIITYDKLLYLFSYSIINSVFI